MKYFISVLKTIQNSSQPHRKTVKTFLCTLLDIHGSVRRKWELIKDRDADPVVTGFRR